MIVIYCAFHLILSYTIFSYDILILYFSSYTVILYVPIFSSCTSHILYFPMIFIYCTFIYCIFIYCIFTYFSCTVICTFLFHIIYLSYTFHIIDTLFLVLVYFTSCSCNCILSSHSSTMLLISCYILYAFHLHILVIYFHRIAVLCFSYHVFYTCHYLLGFMSAYTLEVDMGITVCTRRYYHCTRQ